MAKIPRWRPYIPRCKATRPLYWQNRPEKDQPEEEQKDNKKGKKGNKGKGKDNKGKGKKGNKKGSKDSEVKSAPPSPPRPPPPREARSELTHPTKVLAFSGSLLAAYHAHAAEQADNDASSAGGHSGEETRGRFSSRNHGSTRSRSPKSREEAKKHLGCGKVEQTVHKHLKKGEEYEPHQRHTRGSEREEKKAQRESEGKKSPSKSPQKKKILISAAVGGNQGGGKSSPSKKSSSPKKGKKKVESESESEEIEISDESDSDDSSPSSGGDKRKKSPGKAGKNLKKAAQKESSPKNQIPEIKVDPSLIVKPGVGQSWLNTDSVKGQAAYTPLFAQNSGDGNNNNNSLFNPQGRGGLGLGDNPYATAKKDASGGGNNSAADKAAALAEAKGKGKGNKGKGKNKGGQTIVEAVPVAGSNPYAGTDSTNPYAQPNPSNPYAQAPNNSNNPYAQPSTSSTAPASGANPYGTNLNNPYQTGFKANKMGCANSKAADTAPAGAGIVPGGESVDVGSTKPGAAPTPPTTAGSNTGGKTGEKKQFSWEKKKQINKKDYMIMDAENQTITREGLELNQFVIDGCKNCDIFVLSPTATVSVDYCENCRIFLGPIESSVFIRNCTNCTFVMVCQQFRSRDCLDCKVSLFCQTDPIIETSSNMEFSCFCVSYFSLRGDLETAKINPWSNKWFKIFDFNKREDGVLNYSLVAPYLTEGKMKADVAEGGMGVDFGAKCTNKDFAKECVESLEGSSALPPAVPLTLGPLPANLSANPNDRVIALFLFRPAVDDFLQQAKDQLGNDVKYTIVQSRVLGLDKSRVQRLASVFGKDKSKKLEDDPRLMLQEVIGLDVNGTGIYGIGEGIVKTMGEKAFLAKKEEMPAMADTFFVAIKDDEEMANKIR